ncbi:CRISPR-associated helicase Cas3' [Salinibacter grassmerensis]|uniref:CRISPR-associated helicase Cas3' n=1 Tax=Salinibacter grassmerensis TaxID=3040353 RepID=UPI0021E726FB|nr:CRISPR-associated helicase Cas3' [Salinibacter grassmerensis]
MNDYALAKTDPPLTLQEHTEDVVAEAESILARLRYHVKYHRLTGADLRERLLQAAVHHDRGKAHDRWQRCAEEDRLRKVGLRHELASLRTIDGDESATLDDPSRVAIGAHHNKLSWAHEDRWTTGGSGYDDHTRYWQEMRQQQRNGRHKDFSALVRQRYEYDVVRALLQLADRRASQIEAPDAPDPLPLRPFRYHFPYTGEDGTPHYRPVQEAALEHADKPTLALRSETGSGKTAASLLWAREQVRSQRARRAIIALPTRFTASSLAADTESHVTSGLYHSSAWQHLDGADRLFERLSMARQFLYPLTVTTIDQVLACLTGRREEDHLRFANLAHSALIIDECDFYDDVVQANIETMMAVLRELEVPVLVMSATLPDEHLSVYFPDREDPPSPLDTTTADTTVEIVSVHGVEEPDQDGAEPEDMQWLIDTAREAPRLIVYANTVARAAAYYRLLARHRDDLVLYHSRFTEPHKASKEQAIRAMLGDGGSDGSNEGVAVMTQIGEMSLNVSAPVMVSELCPIDRLAQRTGRLSRFGDSDGTLHLIRPLRDGTLYPAPYGTLSPGEGWRASDALLQTDEELQEGQRLTKLDLKERTNAVYSEPLSFSDQAERNQESLRQEFRQHWLIRPQTAQDEDETDTARWQSRIIGPQVEVFVSEDDVQDQYEGYRAFQQATTQHTVSVPSYRYDQYSDRFVTQEVEVGTDNVEQVVALTEPSPYDDETGLIFQG